MLEKTLTDYRIIKKIASGAFGEIHLVLNEKTTKKMAVKIEKKKHLRQLKHEYNVYLNIYDSNVDFIPRVYCYKEFLLNDEPVNGMFMDLLGHSLQELFDFCDKRFTLKTVLMLGEMILSRIEYIHFKNYIHRDIKPDNFVFGREEHSKNNIFVIDFGLAKLYRNPYTFVHIPPKQGKALAGTARYASLNAHLGNEQGRRDDLESFVYCLVFFLKGRLPWQGLPGASKKEKYNNICEMKQKISIRELCEGLPIIFSKILHYIKGLSFEEMPSYLYLKNLFVSAMREYKIVNDGNFDWIIKKNLLKKDRI